MTASSAVPHQSVLTRLVVFIPVVEQRLLGFARTTVDILNKENFNDMVYFADTVQKRLETWLAGFHSLVFEVMQVNVCTKLSS